MRHVMAWVVPERTVCAPPSQFLRQAGFTAPNDIELKKPRQLITMLRPCPAA